MKPPRILVAGIGNIFFGDDAFGSEVARRLLRQDWPESVRVFDFGIRSIDLVYAMSDDYDLTILIDATQRGELPGTVSVIEPDLNQITQLALQPTALDGHTMDPLKVLTMVLQATGRLSRVLLVGCEPEYLGSQEEEYLGLSPTVRAAIDKAVNVIKTLVAKEMPIVCS
jgi:hydrogenase maturation protease